jgi:hypothetical protein
MVSLKGDTVVPRMPMQRLKNEVAAIEFVRKNTNIPVPTVRCAFEANGRYYIITDVVPNVTMAELSESQKDVVMEELERYVSVMHGMKWAGFWALLACHIVWPRPFPLPNLNGWSSTIRSSMLVLCHNDLSQHSIIVDQETLKSTLPLTWSMLATI